MVMHKRGDGDANTGILVFLGVALIAAFIVVMFFSGSIGKVNSALGAGDTGVIAAANLCRPISSDDDLTRVYCTTPKTIDKRGIMASIFGSSKQVVNCDYLNDTIKASLPSADKFAGTVCPIDTWKTLCQKEISENPDQKSYSILVNGITCNSKSLNDANVALVKAEDLRKKIVSDSTLATGAINQFVLKCAMVSTEKAVSDISTACASGKSLLSSEFIKVADKNYYCCSA